MFLLVISTLEDYLKILSSPCHSVSEKDEQCFWSQVYQFLFHNELEEMAANYKVITELHSQFLLSNFNSGRNGGNS